MAKQANRMMIGAFVVVAVIIMAASLVIFGSGKFFQKTQNYVLYFDGSIMGLNVGAPVFFQGVQVGSVTSIAIHADVATMKASIPVVIGIEPDRFKVHDGERDPRKNMPKLIEKGLRAVLTVQSYITGQLVVELDFHPDAPIVLRDVNKDYMEIPTIPSTSQKLGDALKKLDLEALEKHLESTLAGIDRFVNNPDLTASIHDMKGTLQDTRKLITKIDRQVDPLAKDVKKTVKDFGKLAREVDPRVKDLAASLETTLTGLDKTMSAARGVLSQDAPLVVDLEGTLKELTTMSRSLRELADYLDRHPESLLRGKNKPGGQ